jgi:hypothetical protein
MALDISRLGADMLRAMRGVLERDWPEVKDYAEAESRKLAEALAMIGRLAEQGRISAAQARLHLAMQKNAAMMVLLTMEGMGALMVERAIDSALAAVRDTVNTALRFTLL